MVRVKKACTAGIMSSALLLALGCSSTGDTAQRAPAPNRPSPQAQRNAEPPAQPPKPRQMDSVAVSALRERALTSLGEAATGGSPETRVNAIEALSSVPRRAEPILRAALVDQSPAVRIAAAMVVGNIKLESSASYVEPLLNDPLPAARATAAYALKRCGRNPDMTPIAELLADPSPRWRSHAAVLLGRLGEASALPMLEEAVRDGMPRASAGEVRLLELQVAEARVRLGDEDAIQSIRAALFPARSEDLEATALAAQLVGELNDRASTRELVMLTRMRDDAGSTMPPEVRMAAAGSLGMMRVEQVSPDGVAREFVESQTAPIRAQAAYVLGRSGRRENLELLESLMADPSPQVRVTAAAAIVRLSSDSGASAAAFR